VVEEIMEVQMYVEKYNFYVVGAQQQGPCMGQYSKNEQIWTTLVLSMQNK
jgi:hypothetical protein